MEQYTIQLDSACDDGSYSFTIVFDNGGGTLQFSAVSECERDAWIQALHMASYEYMRSQLQALHTKLNEKIKKATAIEGASDNRVNVKNRLGKGRTWYTCACIYIFECTNFFSHLYLEIKDEPYLEMSLGRIVVVYFLI